MCSVPVLCQIFLQIEGCLAGFDVDAMVCMLTQSNGWILKGNTGCVRFATHLRMWRMSSISCIVAQLIVMLDKSMPVFFSRPVSEIFTSSEPNACGGFLRECFSRRKSAVSRRKSVVST